MVLLVNKVIAHGVGGTSSMSCPGVSGVAGAAAAATAAGGELGDVATGGGVLLMAGL